MALGLDLVMEPFFIPPGARGPQPGSGLLLKAWRSSQEEWSWQPQPGPSAKQLQTWGGLFWPKTLPIAGLVFYKIQWKVSSSSAALTIKRTLTYASLVHRKESTLAVNISDTMLLQVKQRTQKNLITPSTYIYRTYTHLITMNMLITLDRYTLAGAF